MERCRKNHEDCPARRISPKGCRVIGHHLFYPRYLYEQAGSEYVEFREQPEFRSPMCEFEEKQLHKEQPMGPPLPTPEVVRAVNEALRLRRELAARPIHKP